MTFFGLSAPSPAPQLLPRHSAGSLAMSWHKDIRVFIEQFARETLHSLLLTPTSVRFTRHANLIIFAEDLHTTLISEGPSRRHCHCPLAMVVLVSSDDGLLRQRDRVCSRSQFNCHYLCVSPALRTNDPEDDGCCRKAPRLAGSRGLNDSTGTGVDGGKGTLHNCTDSDLFAGY